MANFFTICTYVEIDWIFRENDILRSRYFHKIGGKEQFKPFTKVKRTSNAIYVVTRNLWGLAIWKVINSAQLSLHAFPEYGHLSIYFPLRLYFFGVWNCSVHFWNWSFSSNFEVIQSFCKKNRKIFVNNSHVVTCFIEFYKVFPLKKREFHSKLIFVNKNYLKNFRMMSSFWKGWMLFC